MKRLFLVYDDKDFADWIEEELSEYGRFIRTLDGLDFFFPQWNAIGLADVIILPETVIKSVDSFVNLYQTVKVESPETVFLLIYHREKDDFIEKMMAEGNLCISYDELDTGLLQAHLLNHNWNGSDSIKSLSSPIKETKPESTFAVLPSEAPIETIPESPSEIYERAPVKLPGSVEETIEILPTTPSRKNEKAETVQRNGGRNADLEVGLEGVAEAKSPKKRSTPEEQKAKLQRIKERIVIEEKIVTVHVPVHFNSMLVSIVGMYPRSGATFVTANFARMLGENKVPVAVIEPVLSNIGSTYYELMYGEKHAPKNWKSWAEQLQTRGYILQENNWCTGGVTWIPSNFEPTTNWTEELTMQLLLAAKRFPVTLCDISSNFAEPHSKKILSMSDEIWIVADGDPIQLSHHYRTIDEFKNEYPGKPLKAIGNKWHSFIKHSEWKEAVLLPVLSQIPDLGPVVLKQLWDGKMAWDDTKLKNILTQIFRPMARTVLAKEMYSMLKKEYGLGAKLSRFFRQMKSLDDEANPQKY